MPSRALAHFLHYLTDGRGDLIRRLDLHVVSAVHDDLLSPGGEFSQLCLCFQALLLQFGWRNIQIVAVPALGAGQYDERPGSLGATPG